LGDPCQVAHRFEKVRHEVLELCSFELSEERVDDEVPRVLLDALGARLLGCGFGGLLRYLLKRRCGRNRGRALDELPELVGMILDPKHGHGRPDLVASALAEVGAGNVRLEPRDLAPVAVQRRCGFVVVGALDATEVQRAVGPVGVDDEVAHLHAKGERKQRAGGPGNRSRLGERIGRGDLCLHCVLVIADERELSHLYPADGDEAVADEVELWLVVVNPPHFQALGERIEQPGRGASRVGRAVLSLELKARRRSMTSRSSCSCISGSPSSQQGGRR